MAHLADFRNFVPLLRIKDRKTGKLIPFVPNRPQRRFFNAVNAADREGRLARFILCKARRMGFSTAIQAIMIHRAVTRGHFTGMTVAYDLDGSKMLFRFGAGMYMELPEDLKAVISTTVDQRGKEMEFVNGSHLNVETAMGGAVARGDGRMALHMSEVALWANGYEVAGAAMQIVPDEPGTLIVMESTPKGAAGFFYEQYWAAKNGELRHWEALFYPWFEFEDYATKVSPHGLGRLDDDEEQLKADHHLTDEQLQWRRDTIESKCQGNVDTFREEYPSNDTDCFLSSGRLYFKGLIEDFHPRPYETGSINSYVDRRAALENQPTTEITKHEFYAFRKDKEPDNRSPLRVYHKPEAYHKYAAFVDIAGIFDEVQFEGFAGNQREATDWTVIWVVDLMTAMTVAVWRDKDDDSNYIAETAATIGYFYNRALLAPEVNNQGRVILQNLRNLKYTNLYTRTNYDLRDAPISQREGFETNQITRPIMLDNLKTILKETPFVLADERLKREMQVFEIIKKRPQARAGEHDDLVISCAGAYQIYTEHAKAMPVIDKTTGAPKKRPRKRYINEWQ